MVASRCGSWDNDAADPVHCPCFRTFRDPRGRLCSIAFEIAAAPILICEGVFYIVDVINSRGWLYHPPLYGFWPGGPWSDGVGKQAFNGFLVRILLHVN